MRIIRVNDLTDVSEAFDLFDGYGLPETEEGRVFNGEQKLKKEIKSIRNSSSQISFQEDTQEQPYKADKLF